VLPRTHSYELTVTWTGERGSATRGYRDFGRAHEITASGLPPLLGSADPVLRGDRDRWSPAQLLVAALAQCHLLSYLYVCAGAGVVVAGYSDSPTGRLLRTPDGGGHFTDLVLRPRVAVTSPEMTRRALELHADAHRLCFIAQSVNFPIRHEPLIEVAAVSR
jgi:organic hydroperoxide reductase OsmC/OhrA